MCKRMFLLASFALLLLCAPGAFAAAVGVFDFTMDIGNGGDIFDAPDTGYFGMGFTHELPSVWDDGSLVDRYVIRPADRTSRARRTSSTMPTAS